MYNNTLFSIGLATLELKGMDNDILCKYVKENIGFTIMLNDSIPQIQEMAFIKELEAENFTKQTKYISKKQATEDKNKIIGLSFYHIRYSTWKGKFLFLEDFVIKKEYRNLGIGSQLFEATIKIRLFKIGMEMKIVMVT